MELSGIHDEEELKELKSNQSDQRRRDIKLNPKDKAKERLWASILNDAAEDESDSDEQI